jgi:hypothetical protein
VAWTALLSPLGTRKQSSLVAGATSEKRHKQSFHEIFAMIRKDQVARIPANDIKTQRILIASLFAIAV